MSIPRRCSNSRPTRSPIACSPRAPNLPEDVERVALKTVHANKSPALAPLSALNGVDTARIGLDVERCKTHLMQLQNAQGLVEKLHEVFSTPREERGTVDPDLAIYSGFPTDADKRLFREVRRTRRSSSVRASFLSLIRATANCCSATVPQLAADAEHRRGRTLERIPSSAPDRADRATR